MIPYCGGVENLLQKSEEFRFYPECHSIMDVARYRLEHNIEFSALSEKGKKYFNLEAYTQELEENRTLCSLQQRYVQALMVVFLMADFMNTTEVNHL